MEFDPEATIAYLGGKVDEYVKEQGRKTVAMNAESDPDARYARIPDGNACDFCRMLGSRGFVYHSEELAGGKAHGTKWDTYHPYCNCQIAVSFDYFQEEYYKNGVKVRRGYADDGIVTVTGRDGSDRMRKVDIDALYDEYLAAGKSYTASAKRLKAQQSTRNLMGGTKLPPDEFQAAMQRLSDAETLDELHAVGKDIVDKWPRNDFGRNPEQWREMSELAQRLEREFKEDGPQANREAMVDSKWFEDAQTRRVHWDKVDSKDYTAKMAEVVGDKDMARTIHEDVKAILKKTDKTPFEELYAYDLTTGERIERVINQRKQLEVVPTEKFKNKVKERIDAGHRVVTLHNHSGSNIPSLADIHGLKVRGDDFGVVACHNGEIFTYRIVGEPAEGYTIDSSKEASQKFMQSFALRAASKGFDAALSDVGDLYGVKFERFL